MLARFLCLSCRDADVHASGRPGRAQELVAVIPPAASAAPDAHGRSASARLFTSADLEALLAHVDLFSLNACAPASALAADMPSAGHLS